METSNKLLNWLNKPIKNKRAPVLGQREMDVMEILWQQNGLTVQQISEHLASESISLNTVQSTIERLYRKELLERKKIGRKYVYTTLTTRTELISQLLHDISIDFGGGEINPVISGFIDFLSDGNKNEVEKLEEKFKEMYKL